MTQIFPLVNIIIVTYNNADHLNDLLNSLQNIENNNFRFVISILDNNSYDNTRAILIKFKSKINHLILNNTNIGFSSAVNKLSKICVSDYILLLNPDSILDAKSLSIMVSFLQHFSEYKVVGGTLKDFNTSKQQNSHTRFPNFFVALFEFTSLKKIIPQFLNIPSKKFWYKDIPNKDIDCVSVCGAFMLINTEAYLSIQGFDEKFFMYLEDMDLCIRLIKQGYKIRHMDKPFIYHLGGGSSLRVDPINKHNLFAWINSRKYFFSKYFNPLLYKILIILFSFEERFIF